MNRAARSTPIATSKIEDLITQLRGNYTVLIVTHNMQQAARASAITPRSCTSAGWSNTAPTSTLFTNPHLKDTEDYITGRFWLSGKRGTRKSEVNSAVARS